MRSQGWLAAAGLSLLGCIDGGLPGRPADHDVRDGGGDAGTGTAGSGGGNSIGSSQSGSGGADEGSTGVGTGGLASSSAGGRSIATHADSGESEGVSGAGGARGSGGKGGGTGGSTSGRRASIEAGVDIDAGAEIDAGVDGGALGAPAWILVGSGPARGYMGTGYDPGSDRMVLFSGQDATVVSSPSVYPSEVVVIENASGAKASATWSTLTVSGGPPSGRVSGAVVYDVSRNRLIVHGGCLHNCAPALADTWALEHANGLGGTPTWTHLADAPVPRDQFGGVYDEAHQRLIVFGGDQAFAGTSRNDVWVFAADEASGGAWTELTPTGTPPAPRSGSSLVYDATTNRMIVFGGFDSQNGSSVFYNDVWILTNANGLGSTPAWIQLQPSGTPPPDGYPGSAVFDPMTNRLVVFGGGSPQGTLNGADVWVLLGADGLDGTPEWRHLAESPGPISRNGHSAAYRSADHRMIIASGVTTGVSTNLDGWRSDVWVFRGARAVE